MQCVASTFMHWDSSRLRGQGSSDPRSGSLGGRLSMNFRTCAFFALPRDSFQSCILESLTGTRSLPAFMNPELWNLTGPIPGKTEPKTATQVLPLTEEDKQCLTRPRGLG